jgi:hypothetical protein
VAGVELLLLSGSSCLYVQYYWRMGKLTLIGCITVVLPQLPHKLNGAQETYGAENTNTSHTI